MYNDKADTSKVRSRGCDSAKIISVIMTEALKGAGTENDPCRKAIQYWSLDGKLIAEHNG
jgi:hypothetical protein